MHVSSFILKYYFFYSSVNLDLFWYNSEHIKYIIDYIRSDCHINLLFPRYTYRIYSRLFNEA